MLTIVIRASASISMWQIEINQGLTFLTKYSLFYYLKINKKIPTQTVHEMTLLPLGCVNNNLHLEVCTNEKKNLNKKNKIKYAREVKLWEGMDHSVVFIETLHRVSFI